LRNLLAFIYRYHYTFIFLLMQVFCFFMMARGNRYQGSRIINSSNKAAASLYQAASNTKEYFSLKAENDILSAENAMLRSMLKSNYIKLGEKEVRKNDTVYKQQYAYVQAKVVNASVNNRSNYLTLNAGSSLGIDRDMAVFNSKGIVGIVKDVSENFASVMSILHKDTKVNCQLKRDGSFGPLVWDGSDYRYCLLTDIPTHARIKNGDTVITSELSGIFPEGIPVGTIESYERRQNEPFFTVRVKLSADLKNLNHVYVIKNRFRQEKDSLEQKSQVQSDK
jgi:rod shape-determining protein MreC